MHISTAHYRQNVDLVCAHALQRQIETLVGVDVRKNHPSHEFLQMLAGAFRLLSFEGREIHNANHTSPIRYQPRSGFTRPHPLQGFLDRHLAGQRLGCSVHDASYLTATMPLARLRRRQVYAILHRQSFVDGFPLESRWPS
jgi:hypothetical protein